MKVNCDKNGVRIAVESVKKGGVIIFPTDTVYGIGCDPYNENAVQRIYRIKKRELGKPLPVLGDSKEDLAKIAVFDRISSTIAEKYWPGPLTMILELRDERLKRSLRLEDKIAVRIPGSSCVSEILHQCKLLIGTSANYSGRGSFLDPSKCELSTRDYDVFVDGGKIKSSGESTIISFDRDRIIIHREGSIPKDSLEKEF